MSPNLGSLPKIVEADVTGPQKRVFDENHMEQDLATLKSVEELLMGDVLGAESDYQEDCVTLQNLRELAERRLNQLLQSQESTEFVPSPDSAKLQSFGMPEEDPVMSDELPHGSNQ